LGNIGWGLDRPVLKVESKNALNDSIDREHIKYWDKTKDQKFTDLTGSFTNAQD